jgi:uncharacterized tellurite resistance protein B-like protein
MLKRLVKNMTAALTAEKHKDSSPAARERAIRMATAVLMVDVARADNDFDESEFELLLELIERHFKLSADEASELANAAHEESEELVEIGRFTQLLHNNLSEAEKEHVVDLLWKVAFADGRLSRHEDALVLKISDLLYVNRARVMRLKHDAKTATD